MPEPSPDGSPAAGRAGTILLIHDRPADARRVGNLFADDPSHHYRVIFCGSLEGGICTLGRGGVDVVLFVCTADADGAIATGMERLHRAAPTLPIVVVAPEDSGVTADAAMTSGAEDVLVLEDLSADLLVRAVGHAIIRSGLRRALVRSEQGLRLIVERNADAVLIVDEHGVVRFANNRAEATFGRSRADLVGEAFGFPVVPDEATEIEIFAGHRPMVAEMRASAIVWRGEPARLVSLRDITERSRAEAQLRELTRRLTEANHALDRLATIDPLTELLNRRGLERSMAGVISRGQRRGSSVFVLLIDCDGLKGINDRFGHVVGDVVIREIGARITGAVRPSDLVCRVGGDEFLVVLPETREAEAWLVAERIRIAVKATHIMLAPEPIRATVSIGMSQVPWDMVSIEELLGASRLSLKRAKGRGKDRVTHAITTGGEEGEKTTAELDALVRRLMGGDVLSVWQQPIVRLADETRIASELLSRGPPGPFHSPVAFLALAQEYDVATAVDLRCLKNCLRQAARLGGSERYHVNVLPSTLLQIPIEQLLGVLGGAGPRICLELSEVQFMGQPVELRERIAALKGAGVFIAIDDIGSGGGTLDSVMLFDPQVIKIDRSHIHGMADDGGKRRYVRRLVDLVRSMDVEIIAEGIERRADLVVALELGIHSGQGYLWAKPAPAEPDAS